MMTLHPTKDVMKSGDGTSEILGIDFFLHIPTTVVLCV